MVDFLILDIYFFNSVQHSIGVWRMGSCFLSFYKTKKNSACRCR